MDCRAVDEMRVPRDDDSGDRLIGRKAKARFAWGRSSRPPCRTAGQ